MFLVNSINTVYYSKEAFHFLEMFIHFHVRLT